MILVTGGAGFIGGNYAIRHFKNNSEALLIVDKFTYAANLETIKTVISDSRNLLIRGDIGDSELITKILKQYKPFAIVNFAAESHVDRSIHGPKDFIQTNIVGTFNLLESVRDYYDGLTGIARDCFRFLHVSTDEVYGSLEESSPAFLEANSYEPNSPYAASKAASDHLVRAWFHTYGLPVLTTNCSNNYGPYHFPEKLIPLVILNALEGKPLPIYGKGDQIRDWLFVEDHARALLKVVTEGEVGQTYNIGGNNEKRNIEVVTEICAVLDELVPKSAPYAEQIVYVTDRPGHDRRYAIDATKIATELGWSPQETFTSGIRKTVEWYLANTAWCKQVQDGSYQRERLGL